MNTNTTKAERNAREIRDNAAMAKIARAMKITRTDVQDIINLTDRGDGIQGYVPTIANKTAAMAFATMGIKTWNPKTGHNW